MKILIQSGGIDVRQYKITKSTEGQRLDKFLARCLNVAPKAFIQKMLRKKNIVVNDKRAENSYIIAAGDVITLYFSDETIDKFTKIGTKNDGVVDVVYEDENILVANKPTNLLTQPDTAESDSLLGRVRSHAKGNDFAPVAVNRLDRNTTGLVLFAKNLMAAQILSRQIHDRLIKKHYIAAVHGKIAKAINLEGYHIKDAAKNKAKIALEDVPRETSSKKAVTKITPVEYNDKLDVTMLKIVLETGRSHQIRAHLAEIGHPLVGDKKYGGKGEGRQMLHAYEVVFGNLDSPLEYLSGKVFKTPTPDDMAKYL